MWVEVFYNRMDHRIDVLWILTFKLALMGQYPLIKGWVIIHISQEAKIEEDTLMGQYNPTPK